MKKTIIKKAQYSEVCTYCERTIYGNSENSCLFNLSTHISQKHGKNNKKSKKKVKK